MSYLCSIVIPHYNNTERLVECLKYLNAQSVSRNSYEIIVVDNGTPDFYQNDIQDLADRIITYNLINDPYNCRNIGIKASKSSIIALLDVKCIPDKYWLENGLDCIENDNFDLVSGYFNFSWDYNNFYQLAYGLMYLDNKHMNKLKEGFPAGNLMIRKELFDKYGFFKENKRTGVDIKWTKSAIDNGAKAGYCCKMAVEYQSKNRKDLYQSAFRFGRGLLNNGTSSISKLKLLFPMNPIILRNKIKDSNLSLNIVQRFRLSIIIWSVKLTSFMGWLFGFLIKKQFKN